VRFHNQDNDTKIDTIGLFLTLPEARQLRDDLKMLIEHPVGNHCHISSDEYHKEMTVSIYDEEHLNECGFGERAK
jgi:hypothetical protein